MIARKYMEAEKKRIEENIKQYDNDQDTKQKLLAKLERINEFNKSKNEDGKSHVPTIVVEDKYFDAEIDEEPTDENLYTSEPMSNFDNNNKLLTEQKRNTCYFMSILIGLIEKGMGSYIQKYIIRDYKPDGTGKTKQAVVRLFDENGCPVDFVVDKSKPSFDQRPLWIYVLEKAVSVMMTKTDFKSQKTSEPQIKRYGNGASITKDVDWNELEEKQKNSENIFKEKAFSISDISYSIESIGIQMILGKTCFKKCTGKPGRTIRYAKEGDETLGFIIEALAQGKLVIGSTYANRGTEIPVKQNGKEAVKFANDFEIPQEHVVFFQSIDLKKQQITTIDSIKGKQNISFANFKRHFSDIYVTDFPEEAEILKKKEQSEKLQNELEENIKILNDAKDSIKNFEQTRKKMKGNIENGIKNLNSKIDSNKKELETQTNNSIKSINDKIKQFTTTMDKLKNDIQQNSDKLSSLNDSLNQIKNDIQIIQTNAEQFDTQINEQINQTSNQQKRIKDSYKKTVDNVQQQNKDINKNIDSISNDLKNMSNNIQQKSYNQLLNDKTTLDTINQNIENLKKSKTALTQNIQNTINKLNDDKKQLNTDYTKVIASLNQQKTDLQNSINQKISNLNQLTGENSDFKKLDNFIATKQKDKADLAEQIKKDIYNIKTENQTLKETTDKNVEEMNTELNNVDSQKESYCKQIKEWEKIPYTLDSAKKNL